jgi:hypothetical protein
MENVVSLEISRRSASRRGVLSLLFLAGGAALILFAAFVSGDAYSRLLTGGAKDLAWGPTLFRSLLVFHGLLLCCLAVFWPRLVSGEVRTRSLAEPLNGKVIGVMAVLTVVGLALRLWSLNSDLWVDEVLTLTDFVRHPLGEILTSFPSQNQHMLFSVLARFSFDAFGESVWSLRLPAVLFGVAGVWALFAFGRSALGTREGLLAATLMTVSYHHIWFSQNARGYTGLLFATLLATWAWLEAQRRQELKWWVLYGVAIVTGMWIHMTMAFVVAAHAIVYVVFALLPRLSGDSEQSSSFEKRSGLKPFVVWLLSATVTLQLYALSLPEFLSVGLHEESRNSEWTNPLWVLKESLENLSIGFAGIAVVLVGAAFVLFGWLSIFRRNRRAALWMVLPPLMAGSLMLVLGHNLFPRFFFFAMGFGLLIVIHGAVELPSFLSGFVASFKERRTMVSRVGVAFASLMIVASLVTVPRNYAMPKQDFSGAKSFVEGQMAQGDRVVAVGLAGDMYSRYFAPDWPVTDETTELAKMQGQGSELWLVYTLPFQIEAFHPELWQTIRQKYEIVRTFPGTLNGGEVVVCRYKSEKQVIR